MSHTCISRSPPRPEPGRDWVAQELRQTFHDDRRLLDAMLKAAAEHPGLRIGLIYTCHTFGRDLGFKPHIHLVLTKGGLDRNGHWVAIDAIPGGKLAAKWRYLLCKALRQLRPYDNALRMTIDDLYRRFGGFQVYVDSFYPRGLEAAKYIGRYMGHPPLATSHITHYDGQQVQFWYRETATGLRRAVSLSPLDFISLLVQHIPPRGMQLMRHAGLYARNCLS